MNEIENILKEGAILKELVNYQNNSVVSKTLIDKDTGTITLFAFDEGQGLSEHTVPYDAFVYLLDGVGEIIISGESHAVEKEKMILMPANEPHALKANERFKMMLVMIKS